MHWVSRVDPHSRLKQTINFKRADHLLDEDEEFSKNGQIITAVDSTIARDFVNEAIGKDSTGDTNPRKETRSNLGPKLHFASLVSLFSSSIGGLSDDKLLLLPGHIREVEAVWNKSMRAVPVVPDGKKAPEDAESLSVSIMNSVQISKDETDFSEIASRIQNAFWKHLADQRESFLYSNLMQSSLCDLSELFKGAFGEDVKATLKETVGSPGNLFSADDEFDAAEKVLKWAHINNSEYHALPGEDRNALLSLLILNEILLPKRIKVVLITDSVALHDVAGRYKFFPDSMNRHKFFSGAEYCVRDLKTTTNRLLRNADEKLQGRKHYWADFVLEAATPFPVSDRKKFLTHSSPAKLPDLADTIVASRDYAQDRTDRFEKSQRTYGEEIAKDASIHAVERFKERDLATATKAAKFWQNEDWGKFLELARESVVKEVDGARREFIKTAVMRLVSRRSTEELDGPFKGRFFSCLFLEDHDTHHIAKAISELNEVADARSVLIHSLEVATADIESSPRSDYLVLLGAAALYSDLGHWDQAKLLCDEALLLRDPASDYKGREAHFLSAVCHRMTVRGRGDLEKAREQLAIADELADERNAQLAEPHFTGLRFKAEAIAIDATGLAFDVYSSAPQKGIEEQIVAKLDELIELLEVDDPCSQPSAKKWAEISLRCTSFSLLLMLVSLERNDVIAAYRNKFSELVMQQEIEACSYFSIDGQLRISVRDGLLILFAAKVTETKLKQHKWVDKLIEQLQRDVIGTRRFAVYLPFDGHRFSILAGILQGGKKK